MSSKRNRSKTIVKNRFLQMMLVGIAAFGIGYYLLNYVATWEDPPLGNTFNIIVGCIFIAAALILLVTTLKTRYFPGRKKKKSSKPVFLNDIQKKEKE